MYFNYLCGNEIIRVFDWNFKARGVTVECNGKDHERQIFTDDNGDYFIWNDGKIYLNNFVKISIEDLKYRLNNGEGYITSEEVITAILSEGVENVGFIDKGYMDGNYGNLFTISESRYELRSNYKIELVSKKDETKYYFYTSDITKLIMRGLFDIVRL